MLDWKTGCRGIAAVATLAVIATSCAESTDPWVEMGTGEVAFAPVADGDSMTLAMGAQGGFHFWISVHGGGVDAGRARLRVAAEPVGWDGPTQEETQTITLAATAGDEIECVGVPVVLSYAECAVDRSLRLTLTLIANDGTMASDSRVIVPRPPAGEEMGPCTWSR